MVHVALQQENVVERSSKVYDLSRVRSCLLDVYEMLNHEVRVQNPWQAHSDIADEEMFYVDLDAYKKKKNIFKKFTKKSRLDVQKDKKKKFICVNFSPKVCSNNRSNRIKKKILLLPNTWRVV